VKTVLLRDVDVPVEVAYSQWTQFEEFPRFMQGVESVRQPDDSRLQTRPKACSKRSAMP
jgi:uncharacterized membrane protein